MNAQAMAASAKRKHRDDTEDDSNPRRIVRVLVGERTFKLQCEAWTLIEGSTLAVAVEAMDDASVVCDAFEDEDPAAFEFVVSYLRSRGNFFAIPDGDFTLSACKRLADKLGLSQLHAEFQLESCRRRLERSLTFFRQELDRCEKQFAAYDHREVQTKSIVVELHNKPEGGATTELDDVLEDETGQGWTPVSVFPLSEQSEQDGEELCEGTGEATATAVGVLLNRPLGGRDRRDREEMQTYVLESPTEIQHWVATRCYYYIRLQHTRQLLRLLPRRIRKRSAQVEERNFSRKKGQRMSVEKTMDELHCYIAGEQMYVKGQLSDDPDEEFPTTQFSEDIDLDQMEDDDIESFAAACEQRNANGQRLPVANLRVKRAKHAACVLGLGHKRELERILAEAVPDSPKESLPLDDI